MNVYVNGEKINNTGIDPTTKLYNSGQVLAMQVVSGQKLEDGVLKPFGNPNGYDNTALGYIQLKVNPLSVANGAASDPNVKGEATATVVSVAKRVNNFYYDDAPITGEMTFTADDAAFDPAKITAALNDGEEDLDVEVTVTDSKGNVLGSDYDYTTPGTYNVTAVVPANETTFAYAGSKTFKVTVVGKRWAAVPQVFATVDGKDVASPSFQQQGGIEWDGEAVVPSIIVKAGAKVLTEGDDYTVTYTDSEGNAVEEMVEPGTYTVTIDFGKAYVLNNGALTQINPASFELTIRKAEIRSAEADQDLYAYTGEQINPTFTAYTNDDLSGLSVAIDSANVKTTYRKVKLGADGKPSYKTVVKYADGEITVHKYIETVGDELENYDLTQAGWYVAYVSVPADDAHFEGLEVQSEPFQISTYAAFSDVPADAWYAQDVYKAAQLGYMTGISGTNLFMPENDITRAELAKVFANMAGHTGDELNTPSKFDDVDSWAWYAEPIAWASDAGIVTGYDEDTFGPLDKATREQVAVMLYRYAKNQGKDVSVKDADAALAAYKDGDQVSDWAKEAMAWAVENDIFGQNTDELWAKQNIKRDAVATIAVRFQPEALPQA